MEKETKGKYSKEEVKEKFQQARSVNRISDTEYDLFCEALCELSKEIVDSVEDNVYFAFLSADPEIKRGAACFINRDDTDRKHIICLSPLYFVLCPSERNYEFLERFGIDKQGHESRSFLFHEVAHYWLDHKDVLDQKERSRLDEEANKQVKKWLAGDFC